MVFRWGHSRSRASPFYFKIKTRGFHMITSNVSEIYCFQKTRGSRSRECEGEGARVRQRGRNLSLALALSRSRASRFFKGLNFRHVWSFHVKTSRFYFKIKRRGSRSRVAPTEHHRNLGTLYPPLFKKIQVVWLLKKSIVNFL